MPVFANVRGTDESFRSLIQKFDHLPISGDADAEILVPDVSIPPDKLHGINVGYAIDVEVASNGTITHCQKEGETPTAIAEQACKLAVLKAFAIKYSAGEPVSYVRNVRIVTSAPA